MEGNRKGCLFVIREISIFVGGAVEGAAIGAPLTGLIMFVLKEDVKDGAEAGAISGVFIGEIMNLILYNRRNTPVNIINGRFNLKQ